MSEPSPTTAYSQIRQSIVEGKYRPGQHLIEQTIAEELSLSRTPIREALRMLQSEGLVLVEPNRGATVRRLTVDDVADLYDFRSRLECYAAELAAERATEQQALKLATAAAQFETAAIATGPGELDRIRNASRWNDEFHLTVLEAAAHERLTLTLFRTIDHPLVFQALRQYNEAEMTRSVLFHHLICDAISRGEGQRAGRLMTEHVLQGRDVLLVAIEQLVSIDELYAQDVQDAGSN